jgi:hypothetical protein
MILPNYTNLLIIFFVIHALLFFQTPDPTLGITLVVRTVTVR